MNFPEDDRNKKKNMTEGLCQ